MDVQDVKAVLRITILISIVLACFFAASPLSAQDFGFLPGRAIRSPHFYADATYFPSFRGEGTLEISYDISFSQLQFVKKEGGFVAQFEVQAILYDSKHRQIAGDSWRREVRCGTYKETVSPRGHFEETFQLQVPPGKFELVVRTENLDGGEVSSLSTRLELPDLTELPQVSDLILGRCSGDTIDVRSLRERIVPYPRARFGERFPTVCVYGEIYGDEGETDTTAFRVRWRVLDEEGSERLSDTLEVGKTGHILPFIFSFSTDELRMGKHRIEVSLLGVKGNPGTGRRFDIDETRFAFDENVDETLALLGYIARDSELRPLKEATGDERKRLWLEFWKKRDPFPETPENEFLIEFFERVRFANEHFSSMRPGWKTDRGRIYIRRGPPDQVDSRPMSPSGPAYEVWYYFEPPLTFVFVDRMGFGEYELAGPNYE